MPTDKGMLESIKRLFRSPRILFNKGLLKKPNTDINGFVKDLNNMKIDRDGVVERRLGSRCMVTPVTDINMDWLLYFSEEISGTELAFLVNGAGEIYCFCDSFPEALLRVNKTGFTQIYYNDAESFSYELKFERGSIFDKIIRDDSVSIYNEYGDVFTFNKFGAISFSYTSDNQEMYFVKARLDGLRNVQFNLLNTLSPCIYLDVNFTRMNPLETFSLVPATKRMYDINGTKDDDGNTLYGSQTPRIHSLKGELRVAQVDSSGRIGKMSQSVLLKDYAENYVSLINTYSVPGVISNYLETVSLLDIEDVADKYHDEESQLLFATRDQPSYTSGVGSFTNTLKIECPEQDWSFGETMPSHSFGIIARKTFRLGFLPDIVKTPYGEFARATMWCDYAFSNEDAYRQTVPQNIGELIKGYSLQFLKLPAVKLTGIKTEDIIADDTWTVGTEGEFIADNDADAAPPEIYTSAFPSVPTGNVNIYIRHAAYADEYPTKYSPTDATGAPPTNPVNLASGFLDYTLKEGDAENLEHGMIYDVLIGISSGDVPKSNRIYSLKTNAGPDLTIASGTIGDDKIATTGFVNVGLVNIDMEVTSEAVPYAFVPACHIYSVPDRSRLFVLLKNLGYNNWIVKRECTIVSLILSQEEDYYVSVNGDLNAKTDLTDTEVSGLISNYDVACLQSEYDEYLKSGSRFVVWNDGLVVAISQKCFTSSVMGGDNYLKPVYEKEDDGTTKLYDSETVGRVMNYQTELDAVGYLPVSSVEFINVGAFKYPLNTMQKTVEFLKKMVVNNGTVFVIENGGLWIGSEKGYMTLDAKVALDRSVVDIVKFDKGVMVFCRDMVYVVSKEGKISDVKNLSDFGSVNVLVSKDVSNGDVYGVTSSGEIFRGTVNYTEQNIKYFSLENLSVPITDVKWGSDTDIAFAKNTVWFSSGNRIFGLCYGGWKEIIDLGNNNIAGIFSYRDELCVIINNRTFVMGKFKFTGLPELVGG